MNLFCFSVLLSVAAILFSIFKHERYTLALVIETPTGIEGRAFELFDVHGRSVAAHSEEGVLTLQEGYTWDGASGPAIDTRSVMRASAVHDAFYQAIKFGLLPMSYRKSADILLRDLAIKDGCHKARAIYFFYAVRVFGRLAIGKVEL